MIQNFIVIALWCISGSALLMAWGFDVKRCDFQIVDGRALNIEDAAHIFRNETPTVVTGLVDDWPAALGRWQETELLQRYGNLSFKSAHISPMDLKIGGSFLRDGMTLSEYMNLSVSEQKVHWFILPAHDMIRDMGNRKDWSVPPLFKLLQVEGPFLGIGRTGQFNVRHQHASFWNTQVFGRKRWVVAHPGASPPFLAKPCDPLPAGNHTLLECTLSPRQVLYLPDRWHHETCEVDPYNIAMANIGSCDGWPQAHQAAILGDVSILERVASMAETHLFGLDHNGFAPLHWAASKGHVDVISYILQHPRGANAVNSRSRNRQIPLHYSVYYGHGSATEVLLEGGADISAQDSRGKTALHWAAQSGHGQIARRLLSAKAAIDTAESRNPLDMAVDHGHADVVRLLAAEQADFGRERHTISHLIARAGHAEVKGVLLELARKTSHIDAPAIGFDTVGAQASRKAEL